MPPSPVFICAQIVSLIDRDVGLNLDRRTDAQSMLDWIGYRLTDCILQMTHFLITTSSYAADRLLKEIEEVSMQYGLRLNRGKCCFMAMNGNNQVNFHDGVKLQRKTETVVYLGHHFSQPMNIR